MDIIEEKEVLMANDKDEFEEELEHKEDQNERITNLAMLAMNTSDGEQSTKF